MPGVEGHVVVVVVVVRAVARERRLEGLEGTGLAGLCLRSGERRVS